MATPCLEDSNTIHHAQDVGTGALVSDVIRDPSARNLLSESGSGLLAAYLPDLVSTLPSTPVDGQIVFYDAGDSKGSTWQFRYNAASSSAYKWEFVGGSTLSVLNPTTDTRAAGGGSYLLIGSAIDIDLPANLEGDWWVQHGARIGSGTDGQAAWQTVRIGAAAADDTDACVNFNTREASVVSHAQYQAAVPAGAKLRLLYKNDDSANAADFNHRWLDARPYRVKAI